MRLQLSRTEGLDVHAHKLKVTIQEDHRVEVRLPRPLAALAELRSVELTPEEEETLDGLEAFRHEHPIRFTNLADED
jgi:hypothetical protein